MLPVLTHSFPTQRSSYLLEGRVSARRNQAPCGDEDRALSGRRIVSDDVHATVGVARRLERRVRVPTLQPAGRAEALVAELARAEDALEAEDRKSTRLNSSH